MKKVKDFFKKVKSSIVNFYNRFNFINGWKNGFGAKQADKFGIEIRLSKLTLIELRFDFSKNFKLTLFNIGIEFN